MRTVAAIRHISFEDLGYFEAPLRSAGYDIRYLDAESEDVGQAAEADLLIVLGGPMGVYEADRFSFLASEIQLIRACLAGGKPMLGICLGAQLIAHAMGARVYPGARKELGFAPVQLTSAGRRSPLGAIPLGQPVLHWHGDTFDLPRGAQLLASTTAYAMQAFSAGPNVLALQFHLEAGAKIESWLAGHANELSSTGVNPERIRQGALRHAAALELIARSILLAWLAQVKG